MTETEERTSSSALAFLAFLLLSFVVKFNIANYEALEGQLYISSL